MVFGEQLSPCNLYEKGLVHFGKTPSVPVFLMLLFLTQNRSAGSTVLIRVWVIIEYKPASQIWGKQ